MLPKAVTVACTALSALLAGTASAAADSGAGSRSGYSRSPHGFTFRVLGGFHLKRVETMDSKTSTALLFCTSSSFGSGPEKVHGVGDLKDPTAACEELAAVNGDFTALAVHPTWLPPALFAPVDVEAHGTWLGNKVEYGREFTNDGWLAKQTGDVFVF